MSAIALRRMRIWLLVLTTLSVVVLIAQYSNAAVRLGSRINMIWQDWAAILSIVILFFSYIYAFNGQPRLHKYLRAFLILIPTIILLYINLDLLAKYTRATRNSSQMPFACPPGNATCLLQWSFIFGTTIMAAFVLIEVGMTLAWGPLEKTHQYGGAHGYAQGANVIVISPDQPQQQQQQLYYPQQPLQQQGYYPQQQAPILMQQPPQPYQYQQPVALDPNPSYQQQQPTQLYQQQQQQQYQYPQVSVPYTSSPAPVPGTTAEAYPQSPIATSGGYQQQQPLPPVPVSASQ